MFDLNFQKVQKELNKMETTAILWLYWAMSNLRQVGVDNVIGKQLFLPCIAA